jgi:hypothetical protein
MSKIPSSRCAQEGRNSRDDALFSLLCVGLALQISAGLISNLLVPIAILPVYMWYRVRCEHGRVAFLAYVILGCLVPMSSSLHRVWLIPL